jgi:hypothetical protein
MFCPLRHIMVGRPLPNDDAKQSPSMSEPLTAASCGEGPPNELPSGCPPEGVSEGPKVLFRFVDSDPPGPQSFRTTREEEKYPNEDACIRCSISTLDTLSAAEKVQEKIPYFRKRLISKGVVPLGAGPMMKTFGPGHWSWWPVSGIHRHKYFVVVR